MTNTITILAISTIILSVTFIPLAEGTAGWNGFLREIGFGGTQVYEVSGVSVILAGERDGDIVQLRCLDGDYFASFFNGVTTPPAQFEKTFVMSIDDPSVDTTKISIIQGLGAIVEEFSPGIHDSNVKTIGYDVVAHLQGDFAPVPFDVPVTITGVCLSPSPLSSVVGGEWQGTDTVALFIGYSVLNAYWLAPTLAGLGAGIYLTKNKWKR